MTNTNENLIIEMLQNITKGMDEMKQELKAEMAEMKFEMVGMKQEMAEVKGKIDSLVEMVEHTVKLQQDSDEQLSNTLKYITDKILEHDIAIHTLRNKQ
ncbi:hypothetical protein [Lysinibacillus sp. FSL W8-0992]|uniref:hypothetical protein n=1 Tax=Lysinibacillus sp. FSL W8-0992 TaxID=2954643 RepID=UPI0030F75D57